MIAALVKDIIAPAICIPYAAFSNTPDTLSKAKPVKNKKPPMVATMAKRLNFLSACNSSCTICTAADLAGDRLFTTLPGLSIGSVCLSVCVAPACVCATKALDPVCATKAPSSRLCLSVDLLGGGGGNANGRLVSGSGDLLVDGLLLCG